MQGEVPTALSRDTQNANAKTERFDITEARERQEMAQVIGEIANNSVAIALKPRLDKAEQDKEEAQRRLDKNPNDAQAQAQLAQANTVIAQYGQGSDIQMAVRAVTGVLQGIATGNVGQAVVGGLSPYANKLIKEATTDQSGQVNKEANLMAHALLGAIEAYATGNHAGAGAAGAVAGELAAGLIIKQLYDKDSPDELTEAQKQTVTALSQLASGLSGGLVGDSTSSAISAAEIGKRAVENNLLAKWDLEERNKLLDKFEKQATLSRIEQDVISALLMKDARIDELLLRYQTHPEELTDSDKQFLTQILRDYLQSYADTDANVKYKLGLLDWGIDSVRIDSLIDGGQWFDRPTDKIKSYLYQQALRTNSPEYRIAEGVHDGLWLVGPKLGIVAKESPIAVKVLGNPVVLNTAGGLAANATAQIMVGQPFSWAELISAGVTSGMTTGMPLGKTLIVNAGMGAATSFAVKGNIPQDTALSVLGGVAGEKLPHPVLKIYTPEMLQKFPDVLDKYFPFSDDKSE